MRLTFLGSGTSLGVPVLGCECAVCTSPDPRNQRLRTSAVVQAGAATLLIDAGPDLRAQILGARLRRVDAVLLTHSHSDHVGGIDDLRALNFAMRASLPLYGDRSTLDDVRSRFAYAFEDSSTGSTRPQIELRAFDGPFEVAGMPIVPLPIMHGTWRIHGFRFGNLAYITDASAIPDETRELLRGVDVLVLNALRFDPHPTHFNLEQALAQIAAIAPRRAYLTHLAHAFDHEPVQQSLPKGVFLAYDGLAVDVEDA